MRVLLRVSPHRCHLPLLPKLINPTIGIFSQIKHNHREMAEYYSGVQGSPRTSGPPGLLGLDRKAMEEERLARLSKKRNAESQSPRLRAAKVSKQDASHKHASGSKVIQPGVTEAAAHTRNSEPAATAASALSLDAEVRAHPTVSYPNGVVKRTWVFGQRRQNDIKVEEVLQKRDLNIAVLSSWQLDMDWIASKIDLSRTKLMLVMEGKEDDVVRLPSALARPAENNRLRFRFWDETNESRKSSGSARHRNGPSRCESSSHPWAAVSTTACTRS